MAKKTLRVHIHAGERISGPPIGEMPTGERLETNLEAALRAIEEVKKVHPNAEISVEVEV